MTKHKGDKLDSDLIYILKKYYNYLYFWPQQTRDLYYLQSICDALEVNIIPPNLKAYDAFLSQKYVDVIGTRLHGTIRGIQHGCRSIVISIDNRASEIHADTNLPCIYRNDINNQLPRMIKNDLVTNINLDNNNISYFLNQFNSIGICQNFSGKTEK